VIALIWNLGDKMIRKGNLWKECFRCGQSFNPSSRGSRYCEDCIEISRIKVRIRYLEKSIKTFKQNLKVLIIKTKI